MLYSVSEELTQIRAVTIKLGFCEGNHWAGRTALYVHHWLDLWKFLSWRHCMPGSWGILHELERRSADCVKCLMVLHREHASWDGHQPVIGSHETPQELLLLVRFLPACVWILLLLIYVGKPTYLFCFKKQQTFPNCPLPRLRHSMYVNFQITWNGRFHSFDFSFGLSGWLWRFLWGRGVCDPLDGRWTGMMY